VHERLGEYPWVKYHHVRDSASMLAAWGVCLPVQNI